MTMPSKKDKPIAVPEEPLKIPDITFLAARGATIKLAEILSETDYWSKTNKKGTNWILSHRGVEKIAAVAGITSLTESEILIDVEPNYQNAMSHQVRVKMECHALAQEGKCIHGSRSTFTSTGEASRLNTNSRGGSYLRIMAEKRGYDRGILQHLKLNQDVNIYSEDEAESFEQEQVQPLDEVIQKLAPILNPILNAKNMDELKSVAETIKQTPDLGKQELEYLRGVYQRKSNEFTETF